MNKAKASIYDRVIQSIPVLCVVGCVTALVGGMLGSEFAIGVGTLLFFTGIAVWGFANGGGFIAEMIRTSRKDGWCVFIRHPIASASVSLLALVLLTCGGYCMWIGLKAVGVTE